MGVELGIFGLCWVFGLIEPAMNTVDGDNEDGAVVSIEFWVAVSPVLRPFDLLEQENLVKRASSSSSQLVAHKKWVPTHLLRFESLDFLAEKPAPVPSCFCTALKKCGALFFRRVALQEVKCHKHFINAHLSKINACFKIHCRLQIFPNLRVDDRMGSEVRLEKFNVCVILDRGPV